MKIRMLIVPVAALLMQSCCAFSHAIYQVSDSYSHAENYTSGNGYTDASVEALDIDYFSGLVDIAYTDESFASWTEEVIKGHADANTSVHCWLDGTTLRIHYCGSGHWDTGGPLLKKLTVRIPKNVILDRIDMESVSADLHADIDVRNVDYESVSGDILLTDLRADKIQVETVSGDALLYLPEDRGFKLDYSTVSGDLTSQIRLLSEGRGSYRYGDGFTAIDIETVSGDLFLYPYAE